MSSVRILCRLLVLTVLATGLALGSAAAADRLPREKPTPPHRLLDGDTDAALRHAIAEAEKGRRDAARQALPEGADALNRDLVDWIAYVGGADATFETLTRFIDTHPDWPLLPFLTRRAEAAIVPTTPDAAILAWFAAHPPRSGEGKLADATALMRAGRTDEALPLLKAGWRTAGLSSPEERRLLRRYGRHFSVEDHIARVDYLLWHRARSQATRLLHLLPEDYRALARARMALMSFAWNVDARVAAVPAHLQSNAGLVHDRAYWRRIKGKHKGAQALLLEHKVAPGEILRPALWWQERHVEARRALKHGDVEAAYRLAAEHGLLDGHDLGSDAGTDEAAADIPLAARARIADAEWLAGWIALRFLHRPALAAEHFARLYKVVGYPVSLARGAFWLARSAEAMGDDARARAWYEKAARHWTSFYGRLAAEALGRTPIPPREAIAEVSPVARASFERRPVVEATRRLARVGATRPLHYFVRHLLATATTPAETASVTALAAELGRADIGVIAAKYAIRNGLVLADAGYPLLTIAGAVPDREQSLTLAIARQESQFDPAAVSRVGALGLMQLMPATARRIAQRLGLPYARERLLSEPEYNLRLGRQHLADLLARFEGSAVLALAAYNAGANTVEHWIRTYGDPRDFSADPVDWIELIPYGETRDYVERVLEAAPIYASRLDNRAPRTLGAWLALGKRPPATDRTPRPRPLASES